MLECKWSKCIFFAVVAKQYLSQRLWQFPLLFRRNSGLGLLQFFFCDKWWKVIKSEMCFCQKSAEREAFFIAFFWPEALLCTTRIFTKKSCKEAFCTLVNKVWNFRQFCTTLGVEKSMPSWLECLFSKSSKTDPISRKTTHTETSKGRLFLMLSTEMFVEKYRWRKQQKREAFWMGHLDRKLHMLHLQNVQPTSKKSLRFSFRLKKNSGVVCDKSLAGNLLRNQESCFG